LIEQPSPLAFFEPLKWIDGTPLLDHIEPYRRDIFNKVLFTFDDEGRLTYNFALNGRGKKNWKSADLVLAGFYRFFAWHSVKGNDCYVLANDESQAGDDLVLAKKLIAANEQLAAEVSVQAKEIVRLDGRGKLQILPARDVAGQHGKTALFIGFDEIWAYKNHDLFEALALDPSRPDALMWVTSYAGLNHIPGIPIYDFVEAGKRGEDPRMFFSWYSANYTTDASVPVDASPEERANPSMASWGNSGYLAQQKRRLPTNKYRRLHLNMPGAPDGAFLDQGAVLDAIVDGRRYLPYDSSRRYVAFCDMSGGSNDDATLGIAHKEGKQIILDRIESQAGKPPFNPRKAVSKFAGIIKEYGLSLVHGDNYAGETFKADFAACDIGYRSCPLSASDLYEEFEPKLNAGEIELLDIQKLQEQLLCLVVKGTKVTHPSGDHDDWANACAGAIWAARGKGQIIISDAVLQSSRMRSGWVSTSVPAKSWSQIQDYEPAAGGGA
jgi:hypothetical protein